jgi:hypothetical protein
MHPSEGASRDTFFPVPSTTREPMELAPIREFLIAAPFWVKLFGWATIGCAAVVVGAYFTIGNDVVKSAGTPPPSDKAIPATQKVTTQTNTESPQNMQVQGNANVGSNSQSGGQTAGTIYNYYSPTTQEKTTELKKEKNAPPRPLRELFDEDFSDTLKLSNVLQIKDDLGTLHAVNWQVCYNFQANSYFVAFFVPRSDKAATLTIALAEAVPRVIEESKKIEVGSKKLGDRSYISSPQMLFSGLAYVYHESDFTFQQLADIEEAFRQRGMSLQPRGSDYAAAAWLSKK